MESDTPRPKRLKRAVAIKDTKDTKEKRAVAIKDTKDTKEKRAAIKDTKDIKEKPAKVIHPRLKHETRLWSKGLKYVCGVDEAGRGPLAGPVVVAGCVIEQDADIDNDLINDSKKLSEAERQVAYTMLTTNKKVHWTVQIIDHFTIDTINILQATFLGMENCIKELTTRNKCDGVLIDGPHKPPKIVLANHIEAVIKGDALVRCIGAASIIAKHTRDKIMKEDMHQRYPEYGFNSHVGYPTAKHRKILQEIGPCEIHRKSYAPVARAIEARQNQKE